MVDRNLFIKSPNTANGWLLEMLWRDRTIFQHGRTHQTHAHTHIPIDSKQNHLFLNIFLIKPKKKKREEFIANTFQIHFQRNAFWSLKEKSRIVVSHRSGEQHKNMWLFWKNLISFGIILLKYIRENGLRK